jgi:hypothetical protein
MGKTQSERLLWQFVDEHADRVQAVAINPSVVIGPPLAKHHIRSSLSFIRDLVGWSYPACAPMRLHLVDVGDVSKGHVRNRPMELLGIDLRNTEESILEAAETMVEKGWVKPRS